MTGHLSTVHRLQTVLKETNLLCCPVGVSGFLINGDVLTNQTGNLISLFRLDPEIRKNMLCQFL